MCLLNYYGAKAAYRILSGMKETRKHGKMKEQW